MRTLKVLLVLLVIVSLVGIIGSQSVTNSHGSVNDVVNSDSDYLPAETTMIITNDDDFLANGWNGTGSESDPYVLTGTTFTSSVSDTAAIVISHTRAYFRIEYCTFNPETYGEGRGVFLSNVTHGSIVDCTFNNLGTGVLITTEWDVDLHRCIDVSIESCIFEGGRNGVTVRDDLNTTISNCDFYDLEEAVYLEHSIDITIEDNAFSYTGIRVNCDELNWCLSFSGNTANGLPYALFSEVHSTTLDLSGYGAVILSGCSNLVLTNGYLSNVTVGLTIIRGDNIVVRNCDFFLVRTAIAVSNLPALELDSCNFYHLVTPIEGVWSGDYYVHDCVFDNNNNPLNIYPDTVVIERNQFSNQPWGVQVSTHNAIVIENTFHDITNVKLTLSNADNSLILGNTFSCNYWIGGDFSIRLHDSSNVTISENWFTSFSPPEFLVGPGISVQTCVDVRITNNVFEQNGLVLEIQESHQIAVSGNSINDFWEGVSIGFSSNIQVSDNEFLNQDTAFCVSVTSSPDTEITNNVMVGFGIGIVSYDSDSYIYNNTILFTGDGYGIDVSGSYCHIVENVISGGANGINADSCNDALIERNQISSDRYGIYLRSCMNMTLLDNEFWDCGLFIYGVLEAFYHNLIGNVVNGELLGYFTDIDSGAIDLAPFGEAILVNCTNSLFENGTFGDASRAIQLAYSTGCEIRNNIIDGSYVGIYLLSSNDNIVRDNFIQNCDYGLYLPSTSGCFIESNVIVGGIHGIYLYYNYDTSVNYNQINGTSYSGIMIRYSQNVSFINNIFEKTGVLLTGDNVDQWTHTFEFNYVNGLPLEYILSEQDVHLSGSYGQLIIANSTNVTIEGVFMASTTTGIIAGYSEDLHLINSGVYNCSYDAVSFYQCQNSEIHSSSFVRNGEDGIYLLFCTNFNVSGNEVLENSRGIALASTQFSAIVNNIIANNLNYGVTLYAGSEFNLVCYNAIGYNGMFNAEDSDQNNVWDDSFSLGNYWSDWYSPSEYYVGTTFDRYPQPILDVFTPGYYEFNEDDTNIWIQWDVAGVDPIGYHVERDGTYVISGSWTGDPILVNVDGLTQGTYYYSLHISWMYGPTITSTNEVVILQSGGIPEPIVIGPDDFTINQLDYAEIVWELYDENAIAYEIWVDGELHTLNMWTGPSFTVTYAIQPIDPGIYNYTILVIGQGGNATDSVYVTVNQIYEYPEIIFPDDITYVEGETGNELTFSIYDENPVWWATELDGVFYTSGPWTEPSMTVVVNVDGLSVGTHELLFAAWGTLNGTGTVYITVEPSSSTGPIIYGPDYITFNEGEYGWMIDWEIYGDAPGNYWVYQNGDFLFDGVWDYDGYFVSVNLDELPVGSYVYDIEVVDANGYSAWFTTFVDVFGESQGAQIYGPDYIFFNEGEYGWMIDWEIYGDAPGNYWVYQNGDFLFDGVWDYDGYFVSLILDGLPAGSYVYDIEVVDANGYSAWFTTFVDVFGDSQAVQIYGPDYISFNEGELGWTIDWEIYGTAPGHYWVYRNGDLLFEGDWDYSGYIVSVDLDGVPAGNYIYQLSVEDANYANGWFDTFVDIWSPYPMIIGPDEPIFIMYGETGHSIVWEIYDPEPLHYEVEYEAEIIIWETWWTDEIVEVSLDGLSPGWHYFQIRAVGMNNEAYHSVEVYVESTYPAPSVLGPEYYELTEGELGHTLTFNLYDEYPSWYYIGIGYEAILHEWWYDPEIELTISLDELPVGEYMIRVIAVNEFEMRTYWYTYVTVHPTPEYTPHDQIWISSDYDFEYLASVEGWPGDGSENNPFIIENYVIMSDWLCLYIGQTSYHYVVRNCIFTSTAGGYYVTGADIESAPYGIIDSCIFYTPHAIQVDNADGMVISNNEFYGYRRMEYGFYLGYSQNVIIENNYFSEFSGAINLMDCTNCYILNNTIEDCSFGVMLQDSNPCTVFGNIMDSGGIFIEGYWLSEYWYHNLEENYVNDLPVGYFVDLHEATVDTTGYGQLLIFNCTDSHFYGGYIERVAYGVVVGNCYGCIISDITLYDRSSFMIDRSSNCNVVSITSIQASSAFYVRWCDIVTFAYCTVIEAYRGIDSYDSSLLMITDCTFESGLGAGIEIQNSVGTIITNSIFVGNEIGISAWSSYELEIIGNLFEGNSEYGVYLGESYFCYIVDNEFTSNHYGVFLIGCFECWIYSNEFSSNFESNAYDYGPNPGNMWDDGYAFGNIWDDYGGTGWYYIPGHGEGIDHYPNSEGPSSPTVDPAPDIEYLEGESGNEIVWTIYDQYPSYYLVYLDGDLIQWATWNSPNEIVTLNVDGLQPDTYIYTIVAYNEFGFSAEDTVVVTVYSVIPPNIMPRMDVIMLEGTTGQTISWTVYDTSQLIGYEIYLDGALLVSQPWNDPEITILVDGLPLGTYEYQLVTIGYFVNVTSTVNVYVVEEYSGTILFDYSHGQYNYLGFERYDIPLFNGLMELGYNVEFAYGGLNDSILSSVDALIFGSTYEGVVTYDEWLAVQTWFNSGDRFIWVAGDADYPTYEINSNSTYILEAVNSNIYTEWAAVEDLDYNLFARYRLIVNTTSQDPFVSEIVDGVSTVLFHAPTCVYGTLSSTPWTDFVRLETTSIPFVYPLLYYGGTSYISDLDMYPPLVYTDGEYGPFVAVALQIYAGATGGGRILVSGASPYGDYVPMCAQEYYDVQFDGLRFVLQAIDFAMKFNGTQPSEPPTTSAPDDITMLEGDDSQIISWFVDDDNREHYEIWLNGELLAYESWLIGDDRLDLELVDLLPGTYTYTLILFDMDGLYTSDSVIITVLPDTTPPEFHYYWGTWYNKGDVNNNVVWGIYDDNPWYYEVFRDGEYLGTFVWIESFIEVQFNVDGLDVGVYVYTLVAYASGGSTSAWVDVVVLPDTIPTTTSPDDITYYYSQTDNSITWYAYDPYPEYFMILMDGVYHDGGVWDVSGQEITISVDDLEVGTYEFTLLVSNDAFNITDTVIVSVLLDNQPPVTTHVLDGTLGDGGWWISDVGVFLSSDDGETEVAHTWYRINDGAWMEYIDSINITLEGTTTVQFYSVDIFSNAENIHTLMLYIDKSSPDTSLYTNGPALWEGDTLYVTTNTEFYLNATDAISGISWTEYNLDSLGWVTYSDPFTLYQIGEHLIEYRSVDYAGHIESIKSLTVIANASVLVYTGDVNGQYSDVAQLSASLFEYSSLEPIAFKEVVFTIGSYLISATTDETGVATAQIVLDSPAVTHDVSAEFLGDSNYLGASDARSFVILRENVVVEYTGNTVIPTTSNTIELRATLYEEMDGHLGDLSNVFVTFTIYKVPLDTSAPVVIVGNVQVQVTDLDGIGYAVATIDNLSEDNYIVIVTLPTSLNDYYKSRASDCVTIVVYKPSNDSVTGGGWIVDSNGAKCNFGFNVRYLKNGVPKGQLVHIFRVGDWEYIIKSNAWLGMAIDGDHAFFEAKCVVQQYNSITGELLWSEGNYNFRVDVWDNDGTDVYQIHVYDKIGLVYYEAGFDPLGFLQGGNIVIHTRRE